VPRAIDPVLAGRKDGGGVLKGRRHPRWISSANSIAQAGETGKPLSFKRASHHARLFFGVLEIAVRSVWEPATVKCIRKCGAALLIEDGETRSWQPKLRGTTLMCSRHVAGLILHEIVRLERSSSK
jgi:hypothetical protein